MDRTAKIIRQTKETNIQLELNLDGTGQTRIQTGVGFFDHMLDLLGRHSLIDLTVAAPPVSAVRRPREGRTGQ